MRMSLKDAGALIGVDSTSIMSANKYKPFYFRRNGKSEAWFDYSGYMKEEDRRFEIMEKTKLLVEYLFHIENMPYVKMAKVSGLNIQTLSALTFGYSLAVKFSFMIREYYPFHFRRFDEYYDFRMCDRRKYRKTIYGWSKLNEILLRNSE